MSEQDHYRQAGVDIEAGNRFVDDIRGHVRRTRRPGLLSDIGGFAGFFAVDRERYKDPVLVSGCDGVGTKILLASEMGVWDTVGVDLVAMCVNDVLVHGAEPLFFLDYMACGSLHDIDPVAVVKGVADGCEQARVALLGGETAEMPGLYGGGHFDLAGFAVGVAERGKIIDGSAVRVGSTVIGVASSGLHSNGYSLVRKLLLKDAGYRLDQHIPDLEATLGEVLLTPTRIYVKPMLQVFDRFPVASAAHITGGGIVENLPRMLPKSTKAVIDLDSWSKAPIFGFLQRIGNLPDEEMLRVFNAGIGFVVVVEPTHADGVIETLAEHGERAWAIGRIEARADDESAVVIRRG